MDGATIRHPGAVANTPVRVPKMAELVAARLRRMIVRGELVEGDALPSETALMEEFAVSRPTLREAFRVLESESLINVRRGARGAGPVRHAMPTSEGFTASVVTGLGWGMVPEVQAGPLLRSGRLVALAPGRPLDVPLYWQQWRLDSPALAAVADAVAATAAESLHRTP